MNKKWKMWVGWIFLMALTAYVVLMSTVEISFTSENFPLSKKWSTRLSSSIQQISIINNQIVLVRTEAEIYALEVKSGNLLWHRYTNWRAGGNEPALAKNGIVFFTDSKWVWALNQSDGEVLWQQKLHEQSAKIVDVSADMVAVFDWQQIFVYKATDATLLLQEPVCRNSYLAHINNSNLYYLCSGIIAVSIDTGETLWEIKENSASTAATYSDGVLYADLFVDVITAFDLEKQNKIWRTPLPSGQVREIKVTDEFLLVSGGNYFCVLQRQDGKKLWCTDSAIAQQNPAKLGDAVYLLKSTNNIITAFDIHSGSELGLLKMSKFKPLITFGQLMVSSDELLIFANGKEIFAYGK